MSTTEAPAEEVDPLAMLGVAVAALAIAGVAALLGGHLLLGWLRLLAGVLAGAGLGAALLALPGRRVRPILAGACALVLALALTVPALLSHRPPALAESAVAQLDPLAGGDRILAVPGDGARVVIDRERGLDAVVDPEDGTLLDLPEGEETLLAADGLRAAVVSTEGTRILDVSGDPAREIIQLPGRPVSLDGDLLVMEDDARSGCQMTGHDLSGDPSTATWTMIAERCTGAEPAAGLLPATTLRTDPGQGILELDPATGFPRGEVLAPAGEDCTASPTVPLPDPGGDERQVIIVCTAEDGSLTASAFHEGLPRWTSDPSPAGDWDVVIDQGRVLATGTEEGAAGPGEIVVGPDRAEWTAPGGDGWDSLAPVTSRLGQDGSQMVLLLEAGQVAAYDTVTAQPRWATGASDGRVPVTGTFAHGTSAVIDTAPRDAALDPRDGLRLRLLDPEGRLTAEIPLREEPEAVHPLPGGAALVQQDGRLLLIPPR